VYSLLYLGWFCTLSVISGHNNNNNNNLQFSIILKNESIGLESSDHIFGMARMHFSGFLAIPESNYLMPNQPRYHCNKQRLFNRLVCKVERKCYGQ
jgi:hypothetical protein